MTAPSANASRTVGAMVARAAALASGSVPPGGDVAAWEAVALLDEAARHVEDPWEVRQIEAGLRNRLGDWRGAVEVLMAFVVDPTHRWDASRRIGGLYLANRQRGGARSDRASTRDELVARRHLEQAVQRGGVLDRVAMKDLADIAPARAVALLEAHVQAALAPVDGSAPQVDVALDLCEDLASLAVERGDTEAASFQWRRMRRLAAEALRHGVPPRRAIRASSKARDALASALGAEAAGLEELADALSTTSSIPRYFAAMEAAEQLRSLLSQRRAPAHWQQVVAEVALHLGEAMRVELDEGRPLVAQAYADDVLAPVWDGIDGVLQEDRLAFIAAMLQVERDLPGDPGPRSILASARARSSDPKRADPHAIAAVLDDRSLQRLLAAEIAGLDDARDVTDVMLRERVETSGVPAARALIEAVATGSDDVAAHARQRARVADVELMASAAGGAHAHRGWCERLRSVVTSERAVGAGEVDELRCAAAAGVDVGSLIDALLDEVEAGALEVADGGGIALLLLWTGAGQQRRTGGPCRLGPRQERILACVDALDRSEGGARVLRTFCGTLREFGADDLICLVVERRSATSGGVLAPTGGESNAIVMQAIDAAARLRDPRRAVALVRACTAADGMARSWWHIGDVLARREWLSCLAPEPGAGAVRPARRGQMAAMAVEAAGVVRGREGSQLPVARLPSWSAPAAGGAIGRQRGMARRPRRPGPSLGLGEG